MNSERSGRSFKGPLSARKNATLGELLVPIALLFLAGCCLPYDLTVARFFQAGQIPGFLRELVENTEPLGHGIGIIVLLGTAAILHRAAAKRYITIAALALLAGVGTNVIKFSVGRIRPRDLSLEASSLAETWTGWFPYLNGLSGSQSFPSGHTTVAWAAAVLLASAFPHARMWLLGLAAMVAYGRVQCSAHYPSDVFAGAALGWTIATLLLKQSAIQQLLLQPESDELKSHPSSLSKEAVPAARAA